MVSTNYRIVRGISYKNGEPAIMMMNIDNVRSPPINQRSKRWLCLPIQLFYDFFNG